MPTVEHQRIYSNQHDIVPGNLLELGEIRMALGGFLLATLKSYSSTNFPQAQRQIYARHIKQFRSIVNAFMDNPQGFEFALVEGSGEKGIAILAPDGAGSTILIMQKDYTPSEKEADGNSFEGVEVVFGKPSSRRPIQEIKPVLPVNITRYNATQQRLVNTKLLLLEGKGKRTIPPFATEREFRAIKLLLDQIDSSVRSGESAA